MDRETRQKAPWRFREARKRARKPETDPKVPWPSTRHKRTLKRRRAPAEEKGAEVMPFADPERNRNYQRDYKRTQREGLTNGSQTPVPAALRLATAADVIDLLTEQVEAVRPDADAGALEKARTVGYLAGIALRAIEAGNLATRLEALESVLKQRNGEAKR